MWYYEYEEATVGNGGIRGCNYRSIINQYAADGWRFVAAIPKRYGAQGQIITHELVFEKEIDIDKCVG